MALLEKVRQPRDLDALTPGQMVQLSAEIRDFLVQKVSATGGHLGPNLGVVELTLALHRTFDSPATSSCGTPGTSRTFTRLSPGGPDNLTRFVRLLVFLATQAAQKAPTTSSRTPTPPLLFHTPTALQGVGFAGQRACRW